MHVLTRRTLALRRETLAALTADDLAGVAAAAPGFTAQELDCTLLLPSGGLYCVTRDASLCHSWQCTG